MKEIMSEDESNPAPPKNLDAVLTLLSTGVWNFKIWLICSGVCLVVPANVFYGSFVTPVLNYTCVPPEGHVAADQCSYYESDTNGSVLPCTDWQYDNSTFKFTMTEQDSMKERFKDYVADFNAMLATYFDPRYKLTLYRNAADETTSRMNLNSITEELARVTKKRFTEVEAASSATPGNSTDSDEGGFSANEPTGLTREEDLDLLDFDKFMTEISSTSHSTPVKSRRRTSTKTPKKQSSRSKDNSTFQSVKEEMRLYENMEMLTKEENPFMWWHENKPRFSLLSVLASKYLLAPPSSVESERIFSVVHSPPTEHIHCTVSTLFTLQFDLVCDRAHLRAVVSSSYMLGAAVGAPLGGLLSDRFGRKMVALCSMSAFSVLDLTVQWLTNFKVILVYRFMLGFFVPILFGATYNLCMEICETRYRSLYGILNGVPWGLAMILYGAVAYGIRDWRFLQLTISLQCIVILPLMWFVNESPRWLAVNGHHQRALSVLRSAERLNKTTLPPDDHLLTVLASTHESSLNYGAAEQTKLQQLTRELSNLFHKAIRVRILILWFIFIVAMMIYFGLSLTPVSYPVNPFVYMMLTGLMELPGYTIPGPIIARWGRRWPTAISYIVCGVSLFALTWTPRETVWLVITLSMIGKLCISMAFQIIYVYAMELLPTEIRSTGLGSIVFVSRFGAIITPFIIDTLGTLVPWAPAMLFSCLSLIAGPICLKLPETRGEAMLDTLEEIDQQNKRRR
ncbi:Major facilitator superfamily [Trinorchestia longiramus]|nr:Major facilitator superfamily [Trinorchestia longiramus]